MTVKEIWIWEPDENEYLTGIVISLYKSNNSQTTEDGIVTIEQMYVIAYHPDTGQIAEMPLINSFIKKIYNDKTKEEVVFECPPVINNEE